MVQILRICLFLFCIATSVRAQDDAQVPVQLNMPHLTVTPGDTILVPIGISDVTGLDVLASNLVVTYDARVVTALRVVKTGTLAERWSQAQRIGFVEGSQDTTGLVSIALFTVNNTLVGSGTFINIEFVVSASARNQQISLLSFDSAILNNRNPQTTVEHGSLTVEREVIGDFNNDNQINFQDFIAFAQNFGKVSGDADFEALYDLDGNGEVAFSDFILFVPLFGQ